MRVVSLMVAVLSLSVCFAAQDRSVQQVVDEAGRAVAEKRFDRALELSREAVKSDPTSSAAQVSLGMALIGLGQNAEAVDALKTAVQIDPKNGGAYLNLGIAYRNLRRFDQSLEAIGEAAKLRPTDARVYNHMGAVLGDMGRLEDSVASLKKALELEPANGSNAFNVGLTYNRMGRFSDAIEYFKASLKLAPNFANGWYNLGVAYSRSGRYKEAVEAFSKLLEIEPGERDGFTNLAWNHLFLGNGADAARNAQSFLKGYGWRTLVSPYQALIAIAGYREAAMDTEAKAAIEQAKNKIDPASWGYQLARLMAGEIKADDLLKLATNNDQRTEAHAWIGMDLKLSGKTDEAKMHFQWVKEYGNRQFIEYGLATAELTRMP